MAKKKTKEAPEGLFSNSQTAAEEIKHFVRRIQEIEADENALKGDKKEAYANMKGRGFDTKILRGIVSEMKRDPDEVAEEEAVRDLYREALGLAYVLRDMAAGDGGDDGEDDDGSMV